MFDEINPWLTGGAFALGYCFGLVLQRSRFCMVAASSNMLLMRDYRQLHAYLAALGVALLGTGLFETLQWVDIGASAYRNASLNWFGALSGGLIFGLGAMLAGGCASRTLVRSAEGNLGAFITLLAFALAGMASLFGVLEPVRVWLIQASAIDLTPGYSSLTALVGLPVWSLPLLLGLACIAGVFYLGKWHQHRGMILAGASLGLLVVAGWWLTGVAGQDEFNEMPPLSVTVAGPLARGVVYLTTGQISGSGFSLFLLLGMLLGACTSALLAREFHWVAPAGNRVGAYLGGGAMMGVGAMLAGGCTIGQGLTGLATLSLQSLLAVAGIVSGMLLGLWRIQRAER